jgi:hypothetical protein
MAIKDTALWQGDRARVVGRPQPDRERVARGHERSADIYERHAVLLDRFGAHRSARTERRHAHDEREAAENARHHLTADPGHGHAEVRLRG